MAVPIVSLEALTAAAQAENRHAFRKIAACYRVHRDWVALDVKYKHYSRYGRTEMAVALGCSATVAETYVSVGAALHSRLPLVRAAFESGEIDLARVRTACRILDNLDQRIVRVVEAEVVEAARRLSPGPLENEIWEILLRVAPEEAAALREFARRFRSVSYSPAGELARIRAELTAPEAAAAWQLLEEMADTLCPKDPRGKQERLCDAFMARMHGEPRLSCLCQRSDCPKAGAVLPDRRIPLTMVTVDIATLIGLLANPAYLAGHGCIDPDLARELACNSAWQVLLTEAVTLAEKLGLAVQNPDTGQWERRCPGTGTPDPAPDTETNTGTDTAAAAAAAAGSAADNSSDADPDAQTNPATGTAAAGRAGATAPQGTPPPEQEMERGSAGAVVQPDDPASTSEHFPHVAAHNPCPGPARNHAATGGSTSETGATSEPKSETDAAAAVNVSDALQRRLRSLNSAAALFCTHTPAGRGTRHSSALDLSQIRNPAHNMKARDLRSAVTQNSRIIRTPAGIYLGNAALAAALEAAIAADPTLGHCVGRDPLTDRALIYRPDALTTAAVRLRDRHCRFPGCRRPAERCQLDHINPFDHANPLGGGWSTINNLQCLCAYHHTVKTAGYWRAIMLPGGAILWRSTSKTTRITLPANGTTVPTLGNDLRPHIPTRPKRSGIIAYPHPPDNRERT